MTTYLEDLEADVEMLSAELVARQDELVALYALTQSMRNKLEISPVIESVLQQVCKLFHVKGAFIALSNPSEVYHHPQPLVDNRGAMNWVKSLSGDLIVNDSAELPPKLYNLLVTPILINEQRQAGIGLYNKMGGAFSYPDRKMLQTIASHIGAHIETVLLHQEAVAQARMQSEMDLARKVQIRLLPQIAPVIAGLDLAADTQPALDVGGDFYDYVERDGSLMVAVGDVSGKGMSAAMLMGMVRTTLRNGLGFSAESDPNIWMHSANAALYDDFTDVGMLATAFVGNYQPATRRFDYANAGHSPVVYCPTAGIAHLLQADGAPLGVLPLSFCEKQTLTLAEGDLLLIGTDGLVEARNATDDMFGYDRLFRLAESLTYADAQTILEKILATVNAFSGQTAQDDDQTLIVMKGVPKSEPSQKADANEQ